MDTGKLVKEREERNEEEGRRRTGGEEEEEEEKERREMERRSASFGWGGVRRSRQHLLEGRRLPSRVG